MNTLRLLPLALFLAMPFLPAQQSFEALFPTKPLVELRVRDTKTFWSRLKDSRVGKVVADDALAEIGEIVTKTRQWKKFMSKVAEGSKEGKVALEKLQAVFLEQDGDVRIAIGFRSLKEGSPEWWGVAKVSGDKEALLELQESLTAEAEEQDLPVSGKIEILGEERTLYASGGSDSGGTLTLPFVHEGALYLFAGTDCARDFGEQPAEAHESLLRNREEAFSFSVDLSAVIPLIMEAQKSTTSERELAIIESLGLEELGQIAFSVDVRQERVVTEMSIAIPEKGFMGELMKGMVSREGRALDLLRYLPDGFQMADLWTVDLGEAYTLIKAFAEDMMEAQGLGGFDYEGWFEKKFGFGLVEGFISPLDGRLCLFEAFDAEGMANPDSKDLDIITQCYSLGIKDAAKFGKSVNTVIRKMGWHVSRKKESYRGFDLFHFKVMGMLEVHYGVTNEFFLFALGAEPAEMIRKVVDREKSLAEGGKGYVPDQDFKSQLALLPQNTAGLGIVDLAALITSLSEGLTGFMGDAGEEFGEERLFADVMKVLSENLSATLRKHGLQTSLTGFSRNRRMIRMIAFY